MIDFKYGVRLGTIDEKHLPMLREWRNNPAIWKWCRQESLITEADHRRWYDSLQRPDLRMYTIVSAQGKVVGVCGLTSIDMIHRKAEFSLYVAPEHQRCGYAEMGLKTLLRHGFDDLGLHMIWAETFEGNHALRLFKKLGMKIEGVRRDFYWKDSGFIDATLLSIKSDEFVR